MINYFYRFKVADTQGWSMLITLYKHTDDEIKINVVQIHPELGGALNNDLIFKYDLSSGVEWKNFFYCTGLMKNLIFYIPISAQNHIDKILKLGSFL